MNNFYKSVIDVLKQDLRFFTENGELLRNAVYEAAMKMDSNLIKLTDREDCEFVLWNGTKRLIKRKKLDEFLERAYSI